MTDWQTLHKAGVALCPENYGVTANNVKAWRKFLKSKLIETRGPLCEACGEWVPGLHLHESLVKRNELAKSSPESWRIYSEINCLLVGYRCHVSEEQKPLTREWAYGKAVERYGKEAVDGWLESLPFRELRVID